MSLNEITPSPSPKSAALTAALSVEPQVTGMVEYRSEGRLLIVGEADAVAAILPRLAASLKPRGLLISNTDTPPEGIAYEVSPAAEIAITGYLGAFQVDSRAGTRETDLILDLGATPILTSALPPPGYFAPGKEESALNTALEQLVELTGRFDKPQYFNYRPDICAHGASELTGCTRCIDACPAEAIISIGNKVEVNPYLCQGGGVCATVCPTGAMTYSYPPANDNLDRLRRMLRAYAQAGGEHPVIVLHTEAFDVETLAAHELPLTLEELASVGLELWLSALAFGARKVLLVRDAGIADTVLVALQEQRHVANAILEGIDFAPAVQWYGAHSAQQTPAMPSIMPATFGGGTGGKRETLFAALDHLIDQAGQPARAITLPSGAPVGKVNVADGCTLCMACASVCPAKALADGDGVPALRFYEANCVQCGLCATACPEQVISLVPRLLTDASARKKVAVLNEEPPFNCVRCSKPFATQSVIDRMTTKLANHSMFQDEASINRLRMCGDCRVIDMMKDDA